MSFLLTYLEAPSAIPYGRLLRGQTSDTRIQAAGPHEAPNAAAKTQTKTTVMENQQADRGYKFSMKSSPAAHPAAP